MSSEPSPRRHTAPDAGTGGPRPEREADAVAPPDPRTRRRTIARFDDYPAAQRAVDFLSDERFPVEHVAIVGGGLRYVEQVTGRRGYPRAVSEAALTGVLLGVVLGWFLGIFSLVDPLVSGLVLALWGAVVGAILGALVGAVAHAATGGQRDFSSVRGYQAAYYEVQVDETRADEAERLLSRMPSRL